MFFTQAGRVVAWLAFIFGLLDAVAGFAIAFLGNDATATEYLRGRSTAQVIDRGLYWAGVGIVLGILTEISRSLAPKE